MSTQFLKPLTIASALALLLAGCNQQVTQSDAVSGPMATAASATVTEPAMASTAVGDLASVFDVNELDTSIDACQDFNGFVNAKWIAANPIPADHTRWGSFDELREKSLNAQHKLVEAAASKAGTEANGSIEQKIGWLYSSGMDEEAINKAGFEPIKPTLAKIDALDDTDAIVDFLDDSFARGDNYVFRFGSSADYKNAAEQIAFAFQGGLGLPTTDYYIDDQYRDIRQAYVEHMARSLELIGVPSEAAAKQADAVLAFETRLAEHSIPRVELRKPENQYHFVSVEEADKLTPNFDWAKFFKAQGVAIEKGFSLSQPKFFTEFGTMLADVPTVEWQAYLRYHTVARAAPYLSQPFQDEHFAFYDKTLNGQPEQKPRWKRVLDAVNGAMGQALGKLYVAEYFPPQAKARAKELVDNVRNALKARIENLPWMSSETKAKAIDKWETFLPKIGYPEQWRDWSGLHFAEGDYFANLEAATKFNYEYDINKIGKPTDRLEWGMTPQTVNAYYNPSDNTINFPAAILQPPFFYAKGDDAINYGGIGAVIGHEASHGFDDQGSQFDGAGNNVNWWTDEDRAKFEARTQKLVDQFNGYAPLDAYPDKHVNGRLTLGENIADLGGLSVAYDALQVALAEDPGKVGKIGGYTQDQRFFLNWARVWRGDIRDKRQLVLLNADPHAPAKFRAIGAPSNMHAFADAFGCEPGDAMVRSGEKQVKIW